MKTNIYEYIPRTDIPQFIEFIEQLREAHYVTESQLCDAIGMERKSYFRLKNRETKDIKLIHLIALAEFFEQPLDEVLKIFIANAEPDDLAKISSAKRAGFLLRNFDISNVTKIKPFKAKGFVELENAIKRFFNIENIFEIDILKVAKPLFHKSNRATSEKMLSLWVWLIETEFKQLSNPYNYNEDYIYDIVRRIRYFTADEQNGFREIVKELYQAGVTVIVQSYLTKTSVYGATFSITEKPCIALTASGARYYTLWHTLLHEIYHVLKDFEHIKTVGYHISTDDFQDLFKLDSEDNANKFAAEMLLPTNELIKLSKYIGYEGFINQKSEELGVHPKIIYGRFLHNKEQALQRRFSKFATYDRSQTVGDLYLNIDDFKSINELTSFINQKHSKY